MPKKERPHVGTDRLVVDTVVDLVGRRAYRQARFQLVSHDRRMGLKGVTEMVGRLTAPPPSVDPRTETLARANVPKGLPEWLVRPTIDEVVRICNRQSMRDDKVETLIARILAASIVDESASDHEELAEVALHPHIDLREQPGEVAPGTVIDVSDGSGRVHPAEPAHKPDRSLTDWLARRD